MSILVTGGAGYIGSHMVLYLLEKGCDVIVVDDLSTGNKQAVLANKFYQVDIKNKEELNKVFAQNSIESVIHFAASSLVGESVQEPLKYYENNVCGTKNLLQCMVDHSVKNIVFSSSAAVYGSQKPPITEDAPTTPTNPYGQTKLDIEHMLKWTSDAYGINYTALRYFNAAGSHESGRIGESREIETHLIPIALDAVLGKVQHLMVYGNDYNTPDGTCIRDYIHVCDLVSAHYLALLKMREHVQGHYQAVYNLGSEKGFSVREVISAVKDVTQKDINTVDAPRRDGDPEVLIASSSKIKEELGWNPKYLDIQQIIKTAWLFRTRTGWKNE